MAEITTIIVWTYTRLVALLERDNAALEKAILTINARQTPDERGALVTKYENGRGWNARDAQFGGSLAEWIERGMAPRSEGGFGKKLGTCLTPNQRGGALRMVRKYWRQLLEEIANKGGKVDYKAASPKKVEPQLTAAQEEGHDTSNRPPNGWFTREEVGFDDPDF